MGGPLVSTAWIRVLVALCVVLAWDGVVAAAPADQAEPNALSPTQQPRPAPDFLFGEPRGSFGLRMNRVFARAGSDLFEFVRNQLTIDERDFDSLDVGFDFGVAVSPRVEVVFGFEFTQVVTPSEYRDFVDNNRQPIRQETELREAGVSGSVRIPLTPRGRRISRLAWIPQRATPYVGAGGGYLWYRFQQRGDFIDVFSPRRAIFNDTLTSQGWAPSAHVFGGVDVRLYRRLFATLEGRYLWASARLERSFEGFDPIDLTGARLGAGINVLF